MLNDNKTNSESQTILFSVYVIWCRVTGKFYVGVTHRKVETRISEHKRGKKRFIDLEIKRIGWEENFNWWVVESGVLSDIITEREQFWVAFFDCVYPKGYNRTCGGIKFFKHTEEYKARMRGKKLSEKTKAKMRGREVSEKTKAKLRLKALARNIKGKNHPWYGRHQTEDAKERIRQGNLGKKTSDKAKAILRVKGLAREAAKRAAKSAKFAQAAAEVAIAKATQATAKAESIAKTEAAKSRSSSRQNR